MGSFDVVGGVIGRVRHGLDRAVTVGRRTVGRTVGRTVDRFVAEVRRQLDADGGAAERTPTAVRPVAPSPSPHAGPLPADVPSADELALPDYDHLPSAHVVAALADLEPDERDTIEAYELAGRHRRTILAKLDQLRAEEGR